ncbi:MmgE/PrpD family protein [Mycobacterium sp. 21AC1]|uniref:MmgE/PrpD family protein n=1 Tax=[Mycobacterium] appelbergii TaxID=2939269 RepID=UPI0029393872|nr:MmgE/PrpD family protein [Mycobacterium sp. 21AC1]MDV3129484.1 MmgE/PrpD family protein [Mycobacterium sp. 21AC1]
MAAPFRDDLRSAPAAWTSDQSPAARFITGLTWDQLPRTVIDRAVMCLTDTLAAMLAGRSSRSAGIADDLAHAWWPAGPATSIVSGNPLGVGGAAFTNAVAANAVDVDDCGIYTWGHPGAQVVPAALALAEDKRLSGRELITAIVVGYEIAFRAGRCVNHDQSTVHSAQRTYRACGSWGSVACAALASHVLGLDEVTTRHALGIAEYDSPDLPMMRAIDTPGMVKHGVGFGALTGLLAAELARRGFTGIEPSLDLEEFRSYTDDLGSDYYLPRGITWKRFSSCAWTHPALLAIEKLRAAHPLSPEAIARVVVEAYPDAARLGTRLPETTEEAQFNLAWPVAALLVDGRVGPVQMADSRLGSSEIAAMCGRIEVVVSDELTRRYYLSEINDPDGSDSASVTITLTDGTVLSSGRIDHVLYPDPGWTRNEMGDKFSWLAAGQLESAATPRLLAALAEIESADDSSVFMRDLAASLLPVGAL